jgi:hypothetical protein
MSSMSRHYEVLSFTESPAIVDMRDWAGISYKSTGGSVSAVAIDMEQSGAFSRSIGPFAEGTNGHIQTPDAAQQRALFHSAFLRIVFTGTLKVLVKG